MNRRAQNATDVAALAAAKQLANASTFLTGPPSSFNDPAVKAAHDLAQANGFPTAFDGGCTNGNGTTFSASWYAGGSCGNLRSHEVHRWLLLPRRRYHRTRTLLISPAP